MNLNAFAKLTGESSLRPRLLPTYNNSNLRTRFKDNTNHDLKTQQKKSISLFSFIIFSVCAFITIISLTIDFNGLEPSEAFAQGINQTRLNENATLADNFDPKSMSLTSSIDKNIVMEDYNKTSNKHDNTTRIITLVTEDVEIDIAPGKRVKAWTFNGTAPGPTIRLTEGENVTIKYINKSPIPHTIHFHGNHDDVNDGVTPQIMPGQTYLYNITGEPAGALMYHCHAPPTSLHIRMGMYGALIVDPISKPVKPAKEFVMVMGEYNLKNQLDFEADYYIINGYADQYIHNPLQINQGDLMRIYLINLGTTIPASFHLHSTTFLTYPSGLWDNLPILSQTVSVAPGDASIIEAKWKYPGNYFFHTHGIQEEKGNMGQIQVMGPEYLSEGNDLKVRYDSNNTMDLDLQKHPSSISEPLTKSVSMFEWQYELQKKLQNSKLVSQIANDKEMSRGEGGEGKNKGKETNETKIIQNHGETLSLNLDKTLATNTTASNDIRSNSSLTYADNVKSSHLEKDMTTKSNQISIVSGSSNPDNKIFYDPPSAEVQVGTDITWTNNDDNMPHTVTSGDSGTGPTGMFDSGIVNGDGSEFKHTFDQQGEFKYYCTIHPWMTAEIIVK
ncbi:MAG: multicopper oxidase domain-containing protein [Candidatus Nitrosocosmicus sp.]|uniref:multicopper oxidase domain-containing protein n=1 Tax=Candidatus Nitrosocosmicus agrestis TaxID=2563600 RepID=UPI0013319A68|nr:multicopper oxidase domain-containing protein [Candidatus Nitrosocosmicus sp. SS]KAF0869329.1 hypothetical protein E5N71_05525 [Candidatus Nitrosocosmicus sp. SS]MDR4492656.1 multicopper oxidase domain-containing protein [Candidatus Nitrosocosmicus sp.]